MWLKELIGFDESCESIYKNITIGDKKISSKINGKSYYYGTLEIPTLNELRKKIKGSMAEKGRLTIRVIEADVKALHLDKNNKNSLFQVASQFNLLEMVNPHISPKLGIERYESDYTQGPICAISAGAGTLYRNYFAQSSKQQINCLDEIGEALGNKDNTLWEMKNGYALLKEQGLHTINDILKNMGIQEKDRLREKLKIGLQLETQVTLHQSTHRVSQAYCSALPISYLGFSLDLWKPFANLILEASYEATLCAGILNRVKYPNSTLYLTLVGGGAFGNLLEWIVNAIRRASNLYKMYNLDVVIVTYQDTPKIVKGLER